MKAFRVWLRSDDEFCRLRVEGHQNAQWLLVRLSESFIFKTFDSDLAIDKNQCCTFRIPFNPPLCSRGLFRILSAIPELRLIQEEPHDKPFERD